MAIKNTMQNYPVKSLLLIICAMLSIQFAASQAKELFSLMGVAGVSALRLLFASLMLMVLFKPWKIKYSPSLFLYGASLGLMNLSFYFALERIPLGIVVALEFIGPLSVVLFFSRRPLDLLWIFLAAAGIFLILPNQEFSNSLDPIGILLALVAGFFWAMYIIFGKRAGRKFRGGYAASAGMMIAAIVVFPVGLIFDGKQMFSYEGLPWALMIAFFGSALPYSLEMNALRDLPAKTFGILMSLEPAMGALMGFVFLSEVLTLNQWMAVICVITASLGSSLTQKRYG